MTQCSGKRCQRLDRGLNSLLPLQRYMTDLHKKDCIPCRGGVPPFDISEIHKYLKKVNGWDVKKKENDIYFLEKSFTFKNFLESQKFVNEVGNIAEKQGHHPDIIFGWGYARVQIFTHKIKGLVESDFILAAKIDKI
tara:strand:+ start:1421 stop:1831 length:411 start_codon:yes stop_codon:yes gene_type:complete